MQVADWEVRLLATESPLGAIERRLAIGTFQVKDGLFVAVGARRLHLLNAVGELEKALRAVEELAPKVRPEAVGDYRNTPVGSDMPKLVDDERCHKLCLVYQDAVGTVEQGCRKDSCRLDEKVGFPVETCPRRHRIIAKANVKGRLEDNDLLALLLVRVGRGQKVDSLCRRHTPVPKIKLGHGPVQTLKMILKVQSTRSIVVPSKK